MEILLQLILHFSAKSDIKRTTILQFILHLDCYKLWISICFLGKDAAGIAMEAISFARDLKIDVVLVDTAGRMQDNEPLMRALAKVKYFSK